MLRALREIMDRPGIVPMRIGVNTGKVFTGDFGPPYRRAYRVFGDAINTAARVMSKAEPGQILSTADRARSLAHDVRDDRHRAVQGEGQGEPRACVRRRRRRRHSREQTRGDAADRARPRDGRPPRRIVDDVRKSNGWIVEISGEPGLGKSRLVQELIERSRDVVVLHARCEEYESLTPYYALRSPMFTRAGHRRPTPIRWRSRHASVRWSSASIPRSSPGSRSSASSSASTCHRRPRRRASTSAFSGSGSLTWRCAFSSRRWRGRPPCWSSRTSSTSTRRAQTSCGASARPEPTCARCSS